MKYKTLFRLFVKLIGLYVFVEGVMHAFITGAEFAQWGVQSAGAFPAGTSTGWVVALIGLVPGAVFGVIGLYLFCRGEWIVNLAIPSNRPYCHECGYEVSKVKSHICPECGTAFRAPASAQTTPDDGAGASGAASS